MTGTAHRPTWRDTLRVFLAPVLAVIIGIGASELSDLPWWGGLIVAVLVVVAVEAALDHRARRGPNRRRDDI